jgi:PAP2 superfamily
MEGSIRHRTRMSVVVATTVVMLTTVAGPTDAGHVLQVASPDAVLAWNANAGEAAVAACISPVGNPLHESRMYAMTHIAIHDALNAIDRRSVPYAFDGTAGPVASPDAAVAAAARNVLVTLIGQLPEPPVPQACRTAGIASVEADYTAALAAIPDGPAETQGVEVGAAAAAAILTLRADDGSDTPLLDFAYPQGTEPGEYRFTSATFPFAFAPGWGDVTPFVLHSSSQFPVRPPYNLTGKKYAADVNEVKRLGGDGTTTPSERTADQTQIALFWIESSPLAWNRIARTVSADEGTDLWGNARLFGLLNMALADGYVGTFETKYELNFWRPITAIRAAGTDGNPDTDVDATWTPLVTNPPIPEHDSGHAVEGGAAAQVMRRFFGTDAISFEACSMTLPAGSTCTDVSAVSRSYTSFTQAAAENGLSRILVGFHFRNAVEQGIKHGTKIGQRAVNLFLLPVE